VCRPQRAASLRPCTVSIYTLARSYQRRSGTKTYVFSPYFRVILIKKKKKKIEHDRRRRRRRVFAVVSARCRGFFLPRRLVNYNRSFYILYLQPFVVPYRRRTLLLHRVYRVCIYIYYALPRVFSIEIFSSGRRRPTAHGRGGGSTARATVTPRGGCLARAVLRDRFVRAGDHAGFSSCPGNVIPPSLSRSHSIFHWNRRGKKPGSRWSYNTYIYINSRLYARNPLATTGPTTIIIRASVDRYIYTITMAIVIIVKAIKIITTRRVPSVYYRIVIVVVVAAVLV